jgi:hypothetical protein
MTRRAGGVLVVVLLLALYLVPQLTVVHHYALGLVRSSLAEAGYTISHTASTGNLWHGVRLQDSRLYGPGVDIAIAELTIHYTLPALVMGQLPLSVSASGLSGSVTLADLKLPAGGEGSIHPVLRSATLSDVAIYLTDLPYTLPDMRFSEVQISPAGSAFEVAVTVTTANGSAELDGVVSLNPLTIEAEVVRADATLGRHWWEGVTGGSARGSVTVQDGSVEVALDFTDGSAMLTGIKVSEVAGRAVMRDLVVQAELSGQALGGSVRGVGAVHILQERWEAAVTGEPSLVAAARWLSAGRIPDLTELLGLSGQGSASLSLSGWESIAIRGEAVGSGALLGEPLTALSATFSSDGAADTRVEVSAEVGDGSVAVTLSPHTDGFDLTLHTRALPLPGGLHSDAVWQLTQRQTLTSELRAAIGGAVLGRPLSGLLSGNYREGVWEFNLQGTDDYGAALLGTAALHDGQLKGSVTASGLTIPHLSGPLNLALSADGPFDSLPLQLAITAPETLSLRMGGVDLATDLRGELHGIFKEGQLSGQGELGALRLSGSLSLQPWEAALNYRLNDTSVSGLVSGSLALEGGLVLDSTGPTASASLRGSQLALGPVELPALDAALAVAGEALTLTAPAQGLALVLQQGVARLALEGTRLTLADQAVTVTGSAEAALDDLAGVTFALSAASEQATLQAQGSAAQAEMVLTVAPGFTQLQQDVTLSGELRLQEGRAALRGALGTLALDISALLSPWQAEAVLSHQGETLVGTLSAERWTLNGSLSLAPLGGLLDLPLTGGLQADLSGSAAGFSGQAGITGSYAQQPFSAALRGEGAFIAAALETVTGGVPLTLTGAVFPALDATLTVAEFGAVAISGNLNDVRAEGESTLSLPAVAGFKLPPEPWTLRASLAERQAQLTVGRSQATLSWQAGGWHLAATVAQQAAWQGLPLALSATVAAGSDNPSGDIRGELSLAGQPLEIAGTLDGVALSGTLAVPPLAAALGAPELAGTLTLTGQLQPQHLFSLRSELEPTYALEALWHLETKASPDNSELAIHVSGSSASLQAHAQTEGFTASFDSGSGLIAVSAAERSLRPFLPLAASLTGDLTFDPALKLWSGALTAAAAPFALTLQGDGPQLRAELTAETAAYRLRASGMAFPELELAVLAEAPQLAAFAGTLSGAYDDAALQGEVTITPPTSAGIAVSPLQAGVQGRWRGSPEASELRLQGDSIDLWLQRGAWSGGIDLGVAVQGAAHALKIAISGALNDPRLQGVLSGPLISGEIDGAPLSAPLSLSVTAQATPWLNLSAEGTIDRQGVWQASGAIKGQLAGLPLTGSMAGSGRLASFQAEGMAALAGQPLPLRLTGDGALIQASTEGSLDLAALSTALPIALSGTLDGSAKASLGRDGFDYRLELALLGMAEGQTFALTASAATHGLTVQGEAFGARVALSGDLSKLQLDLSGPEALKLSATATLDEELTVQGSGSFRGQPLQIALRLEPTSLTGQASIHYGTALLELQSTSQIEATLSWPQWPDPIRARLERVELLGEALGGFALALSTQEFTLLGHLDSSLTLTAWQSSGRLEAPWWGLALESDLRWQAETGFMGRAGASAALAGLKLGLTLQGDTTLSVTGTAALAGQRLGPTIPLANLSLRLSQTPWHDPRLAGGVRLNAPLSQWLASRALWPIDRDLWLSGDITLMGDLTAPQLSGQVQLAGAVEVQGSLTGGLSRAELLLTGPALSLSAHADTQGWELSTTASALPLPFGLSIQGEVQASAVVAAGQRWGEAPHLHVSELTLRRRESLLSGWLEYRDRWQGTLNLDLNLADLTPLRGRLHGPLTVGGEGQDPSLAGAWQLDALGLPGANWGLSGTALLGGTGAAPQLTLSLSGEGAAQGQLEVRLEPQQAVLRGSGELSWDELGLRLEDGDPAGQRLKLLGDGRLAGWRLDLAPGEAVVRLSGDLASLGVDGAGELAMVLDWGEAATTWLSGTLQGGALSGVALGDMTITAASDTLRVEGERIAGTLAMADLSWQGQLNLTLPGGLDLDASLQGIADQAELSATLSTTLLGEPVALPVSAAYRAGRISAWADAPLLGGQLTLEAHHDNGGWQGALAMTEVTLAGAQLTATGNLSGPLGEPRLSGQLSLTAGAETRLSGTFEAGPAGVSVAQQLSSALLATPLSITGTLAPRLELSLANGYEALRLSYQGQLKAEGSLSLALPGALLTLAPSTQPAGWLDLALALDAGLALAGTLPRTPASLLGKASPDNSWLLQGTGATSGALDLQLAERAVNIRDLTWQSPIGRVALDGRLSLDGQGRLSGRWQSDFPGGPGWLTGADLPFELSVTQEAALLSLAGPLGSGGLTVSWREALQAEAALALQLGEGRVRLELAYHQAHGPQGHLELTQVPVWEQGDEAIALSASFALEPTGVTGTGRLQAVTGTPHQGTLEVSGELGWMQLLPGLAGYMPGAADHTLVQVRINSLELSALPGLSQRLPHLHAPVSGTLQLRDAAITGQLVSPELRVLEQTLPGTLELAGTLERLEARGSLGQSQLSATLSGNHLEGLLNLREFPLQVLAEAAVGETGVDASATGLARFSFPLDDPASGMLRVASERLLLERDGILTEGEVAFRYDETGLVIETAEFRGDGQWQATGAITPTGVDFRLQADEANFTPLLGLFPAFAEWQVGARGSLTLVADGTLAAPRVSLISPRLDLAISGTNYRLDGLSAQLEGGRLTADAQLWGLDPVNGRLAINARGSLSEQTLQVSFSGAAEVPLVGSITNLVGELRSADGNWTIAGEGYLGNRFTFGGSLNPLQLQLAGNRLTLSAPTLFVAQAEADVAIGLRYDDAFLLTGEVISHQTRLVLGSGDESPEAPAVVVRGTAANPALERIRFDNLIVRAPQQVQFRANVGNAELGVDLVVGGSAAQLELQGTAQTIRGTFRFAGVDFTVTRGVASFEPSRGAYPVIELRAEANFDKLRVLGGLGGRYEFVAPREGGSFQMVLELRGEFSEVAPRTFRLVLTPTLTSNALLQEVGNGGSGPRPLSSDELLALLTLGRLEVNPQLAGGLVGSVAQSAFDTALDLFVLSELQGALGQALGVDLLEIRTTALSSLFATAPPEFDVSLRVGGYLSEELFASFSVGRGQAFALRNEFSLHYELGPLALALRGGVNLLNDQRLTPIPEFGLSLGYAISPLANLEVGLGISSVQQRLSFGISLRW